MYDSFLEFINDQHLLQPTDRVLLAVSGGLDSVVMTDLMIRAGYAVGIAHVNFGLRGADSDADEAFVTQLAAGYNRPCHTTRFNTLTVAREQGLSVQVAARQLRYDWFEAVARGQGYTWIATAHHQNDVLETLLLNLVRGTGLAGLRSIPIRQGRIIRPLWFASRDEVRRYAHDRGLHWREDVSNASDKYARNRLRHQVVPVLEALNPDLITTFGRTIERLRAAESVLNETLATSWQACAREADGFWIMDLEQLRSKSEWAFRLSEWLKPFGFTYGQVQEVVRVVEAGQKGQVFRSATHGLWHDRAGLILAPLSVEVPFDYPLPPDETGRLLLPDGRQLNWFYQEVPAGFVPRNVPDTSVGYLDADRLDQPLHIRTWRQGDRFQPLNMRGTKLVSDLLNDRKVSLPERARTAVLTAGEKVVWVVGHRLSHTVRITDSTRRVLVVRLQNSESKH
ncbi:tRNA lysidine(34) synthetase TilS [Rudanella paleaurantiibacter]|uniref:tRNA(Ile)-lysidine synthase n=2 Tax=Rudanella paleaurantiibacter TaxID=2614655 RepID=A0A7J5TVK7_9BACT|nr:tRNA lysidine(34) synthetase TilS [Rudanella paleaurantiibacter]